MSGVDYVINVCSFSRTTPGVWHWGKNIVAVITQR